MPTSKWETQIINALKKSFTEYTSTTQKNLKKQIMAHIEQKQATLTRQALLKALKKAFTPAQESKEIRIKNTIMAGIKEEKTIHLGWIWNSFSLKSSLAISLSFAIIFSNQAFFPQTSNVSASEGIYVQARNEGPVLVDGKEIAPNTSIIARSGAHIQGPANIISPTKAIIRMANEQTKSILYNRENEKVLTIKLESGSAWGQSLSIPIQILGSNFNTTTELGSTMVNVGPLYTRVLTTNVATLQVNQRNAQFLSTRVFPNEQALINNRSFYTRKERSIRRLTPELLTWININIQEDHFFLMKSKEERLTKERNNAGPLPGELFYSLEAWYNKTKKILTISPQHQVTTQLQEAGKAFSKAIALFEKGNETIAQLHLQAFEANILYAAKLTSDTVPQEHDNIILEITEFLNRKQQSLAGIQEKDPLSIMKRRTDSLVLTVSPHLQNSEAAINILFKSTSEHLNTAHQAAQQGNIQLAKEELEEYLATKDTLSSLIKKNPGQEQLSQFTQEHTDELAIINNLQTFPELKELAKNIGDRNQEQLSVLLQQSPISDTSAKISGKVL
jgi:hypothetical protein